MKLEFFLQIFENSRISSFMKIRPVGAESLLADGGSNVTKLIIAFRIFAKSLKMAETIWRDIFSLHNLVRQHALTLELPI